MVTAELAYIAVTLGAGDGRGRIVEPGSAGYLVKAVVTLVLSWWLCPSFGLDSAAALDSGLMRELLQLRASLGHKQIR